MSSNWLTRLIGTSQKEGIVNKDSAFDKVSEGMWQACPSCTRMHFYKTLEQEHHVCPHCGFHMALDVIRRLELLFDEGVFDYVPLPETADDPLKFKDSRRYTERLKKYRAKTTRRDAAVVAAGNIGRQASVALAFDFQFMGGSMGCAVGEAFIAAAEAALLRKAALVVIPASGGARMQEGLLSLMQMPRTIVALDMVRAQKLPYIVLLTNPTMGGVTASFAMLGDIHIAEPAAVIGFAGRRVIEQTIRETLPEDFQTAEHLEKHGMVDRVVHRHRLNEEIGRILSLLMNPRTA